MPLTLWKWLVSILLREKEYINICVWISLFSESKVLWVNLIVLVGFCNHTKFGFSSSVLLNLVWSFRSLSAFLEKQTQIGSICLLQKGELIKLCRAKQCKLERHGISMKCFVKCKLIAGTWHCRLVCMPTEYVKREQHMHMPFQSLQKPLGKW